MTKQKKLVLSIAENSNAHLTAEEIFILAKKEMPNIALGTVYRNLNHSGGRGTSESNSHCGQA